MGTDGTSPGIGPLRKGGYMYANRAWLLPVIQEQVLQFN